MDVSEIEGWEIDLGIKTSDDCLRYGGICVGLNDPRPISTTKVGLCVDNHEECIMPDFYEDTCLIPKPPPGMPNPASGNCADVGGTSVIEEFPIYPNQVGVCEFPDGSECGQWELFHRTCVKGQCKNGVTPMWDCSKGDDSVCTSEDRDYLETLFGSRSMKIRPEDETLYEGINWNSGGHNKGWWFQWCCTGVLECK